MKVRISTTNSYKVNLVPSSPYKIKSDLVNRMAQKLGDLSDVVISNLSSNTGNYVLTYDASTNKYVFVDPDVVLLAAANLPTNQVTASGVPESFSSNVTKTSKITIYQNAPSSTWTINHNLGYQPSVELFDSGGNEFDADITHTNLNQFIVYLTTPISGYVRIF